MDEPTPEQMDAIKRWLETEPGQKYIRNRSRAFELIQEQKQIINEILTWLEKPNQNNTNSYNLIGRFIVKFSHMETLLRAVFGIESRVQSSLREALMMTFDFALLVSTLKSFYEIKLENNKALQRNMINSLNMCLAINTERVRVAHGVWILNEEEMAKLLHLKRGAMSSDMHFGDHKTLSDLIKKTEDACKQFVSVLFEVFEYESEIV